MLNKRKEGEFFAITAAVLWGLNYPFIKMVLGYMPVGQFIFLRYLLVVGMFFIYLKIAGYDFQIKREHVRPIFFLGFIGIGLYNIIWTAGIAQIAASDSALLMSTSPILTGIFTMLTGSEQMNCRKWAGTFLAFGGIYAIISCAPGFQFRFDSSVLIGDILTLASALLFAFYTIGAKPLLEHYPPVIVTSLAMTAGLPLLFIAALWEGWFFTLPNMPLAGWSQFLYVALVGTNFAFVFWYQGVKYTTPFQTIIFHFIVPIGSMFFGALLLGETVNGGRILGAILVFAGLLLVKYDQIRN
jgi:drug/metabolite transporter (DMT)-like permease